MCLTKASWIGCVYRRPVWPDLGHSGRVGRLGSLSETHTATSYSIHRMQQANRCKHSVLNRNEHSRTYKHECVHITQMQLTGLHTCTYACRLKTLQTHSSSSAGIYSKPAITLSFTFPLFSKKSVCSYRSMMELLKDVLFVLFFSTLNVLIKALDNGFPSHFMRMLRLVARSFSHIIDWWMDEFIHWWMDECNL